MFIPLQEILVFQYYLVCKYNKFVVQYLSRIPRILNK